MRILHLSMLYPPHIMGGAERSVAMLAEASAALGHDVAAACIARVYEPKTMLNGVAVYRMPHSTDFWPEDWPQYSRPQRFISKFKQQFNNQIERRFLNVLDEFKPQVVHTHSLVDVSTLVWRAAKVRGLPIVHTLRDYSLVCSNASLFEGGRRCEQRHLKCRVLTFRRKQLQNRVDAVVGVGAEILDKHIEMGLFQHIPPSRRRVIWNPALVDGAGPGYVRPSREGKPFTFGYLGRINVEKGVGTLIDACRMLPKDTWQLKIAGVAVEGLDYFSKQSEGLPVEFVGFKKPKEFFEDIDVLVVPSIWPEPLPRTILESYAVGTPAIGARSGGIPDLIGATNDQWLFAPGNADELAARMAAILAKPRSSLPRKSDFAHVLSDTTPQLVAEKYLALYEELINVQSQGHAA
jgi:glycosyltransferase involved in cell wall biosynthesis